MSDTMSSKKMADIEMSTEDGNSTHERRALKVGGFKLLALSFSCLGIIYSDVSHDEPRKRRSFQSLTAL